MAQEVKARDKANAKKAQAAKKGAAASSSAGQVGSVSSDVVDALGLTVGEEELDIVAGDDDLEQEPIAQELE
jgi:hypothetical protein